MTDPERMIQTSVMAEVDCAARGMQKEWARHLREGERMEREASDRADAARGRGPGGRPRRGRWNIEP